MVVKASVSISEQQDEYARRLVEDGRYSSLSAVVQRGLELVREETEMKDAELSAMKALIAEREDGTFLSRKASRQHLEEIIAETKKSYGL